MDIKTFYGVGAFLFAVGVFGNFWHAIVVWNLADFGSKISMTSGIAFNILLTAFFIYLYRVTPSTKISKISETEIQEMFNGKNKNKLQ